MAAADLVVAVPAPVKSAALLLVGSLYEQRESQGTQPVQQEPSIRDVAGTVPGARMKAGQLDQRVTVERFSAHRGRARPADRGMGTPVHLLGRCGAADGPGIHRRASCRV